MSCTMPHKSFDIKLPAPDLFEAIRDRHNNCSDLANNMISTSAQGQSFYDFENYDAAKSEVGTPEGGMSETSTDQLSVNAISYFRPELFCTRCQIYLEVRNALYCTNRFSFDNLRILNRFTRALVHRMVRRVHLRIHLFNTIEKMAWNCTHLELATTFTSLQEIISISTG